MDSATNMEHRVAELEAQLQEAHAQVLIRVLTAQLCVSTVPPAISKTYTLMTGTLNFICLCRRKRQSSTQNMLDRWVDGEVSMRAKA